ncbi:MAG: TldD/PmbA family protein [Candidatus Odinarchaeota archaeon]
MEQEGIETVQSYLEKAVDRAIQAGADMIIGKGINSIEHQIRFSKNKIDINKTWMSRKIEFILVVGGNQMLTGEFSPSSEGSVKTEIDRAIKFAHKVDPSSQYAGVEDKIQPFPTLDKTFDEKIDDFVAESTELVNMTIEKAGDAGAKRVAGSLLFGKKEEAFISSAGPKGEFKSSYYNLTVRAFQEGLDASGQGLACGISLDRIGEEFEKAGKSAGEFSKDHLNCKQGKSGIYDLILSPAVAANLLGGGSYGGGLMAKANPDRIMMGRSPFKDEIGEQIAPEFVNIDDNAIIKDGLASAPFDFEGTPHRITPLIKNGVLVNFIHNTSTARKFDTETTGNSALAKVMMVSKSLVPRSSNVVFNNGDHSFEELLEGNKSALYITCNWYTRFTSEVSTEFSTIPRDAMFIVESGKIGEPIKNIRISDNLLRMMKNITAMGNDRVQVKWWEVDTPTWTPTIRISDCRITTATK